MIYIDTVFLWRHRLGSVPLSRSTLECTHMAEFHVSSHFLLVDSSLIGILHFMSTEPRLNNGVYAMINLNAMFI